MSLRNVLSKLREASTSEFDKGSKFERLVKLFLQKDALYSSLFEDVWLWNDYPNRGDRPDTGIDLVARERFTGDVVAIQCKFYSEDTPINKPSVDSFLASSSKTEFSRRMFVTTTDIWGKNAREALESQSPKVSILTLEDLEGSSIDWSTFDLENLEGARTKARKVPRKHQRKAIDDCLSGFATSQRGRLVMACGTGKTFTSLRLAEELLPIGGNILFLVPSISLLSQALREWAANAESKVRAVAVCSDKTVGRKQQSEDLSASELAYPSTTNPDEIYARFQALAASKQDGLNVIFSTYQSLQAVSDSQKLGLPIFDLVICDEAHRTTGVRKESDLGSTFIRVHDDNYISAKKRLYMTATPKVFSDATASKADDEGLVLADMNDPETFGPEFHRLGFGEAVEKDILSDYKVLVLAVDENYVARKFQRQLADEDNQLNLEDTAKIVGCWNGLSKRGIEPDEFGSDSEPMKRAVAFASSIAESKKITAMFQKVIQELNLGEEATALTCEVEHVDGTNSSATRNERIAWLQQNPGDNVARVLSNARCLTEGIDVPALDAVMFLRPRESQVDVVQAVGRVMRKSEGKKYGYVILPIAVPADTDPEIALADNKKYKVIWQVLQALRSHDERFDAMVNRIDLTGKTDRLEVIGVGEKGEIVSNSSDLAIDFPSFDQWKDAILSRIVKKVGERLYWEKWAKDVAEIARTLIVRLEAQLLQTDGEMRSEYLRFLQGLKDNLHPSIGEQEAIEMLAQHLITRPVFQALFNSYDFVDSNPVAQVLDSMAKALEPSQVGAESKGLSQFYESVSRRAQGIESSSAKQTVLKQLYEEFFKNAFPRTSERLGIVYTPNEVVDFMLRITDGLLEKHFSKALKSKEVHILDPFTGTGTFVVRLIQSGLIPDSDLARKFESEVHANELVLLAYYVASTNIEAALFDRTGKHAPFAGLVLTDTFQLSEGANKFDDAGVFEENNERAIRQNKLNIQVIIGNPPYSVGSDSGDLEEVRSSYDDLDASIRDTYAEKSTAKQKKSLYDSYFRAFRWATNRMGDEGLIAFVTNGAWIDSNSADGFRASIQSEFNSIYVVNLRGNQRTSGETSRREGGKIFGSGSRAPVAIVFLIKQKNGKESSIKYFDIGDYKSREEKLETLEAAKRLEDVPWEQITPNAMNDWINPRSDEYETFLPLSEKSNTGNRLPNVFSKVSRGVLTARDAWAYNYSKDKLAANMSRLIEYYETTLGRPELPVDPKKISWDGTLIDARKRSKLEPFDVANIRAATPRPFIRSNLYFSRLFNNSVYSMGRIFPKDKKNIAIIFPAPSDRLTPGAFIVDAIPDIAMTGIACQAFPLYTFEESSHLEGDGLFDFGVTGKPAISDEAVAFVSATLGKVITREQLFYYVYGALAHDELLRDFNADFKKIGPRIPLFKDFDLVEQIGRKLAALHLDFDAVEPFDLKEEWSKASPDDDSRYNFQKLKLIKTDDGFSLKYNNYLTLTGLPGWVNDFQVFNKSPLQWIIDRYQVKLDSDSGIENYPTDLEPYLKDKAYFVNLVKRLVTVTENTLKLKSSLPAWSERHNLDKS